MLLIFCYRISYRIAHPLNFASVLKTTLSKNRTSFPLVKWTQTNGFFGQFPGHFKSSKHGVFGKKQQTRTAWYGLKHNFWLLCITHQEWISSALELATKSCVVFSSNASRLAEDNRGNMEGVNKVLRRRALSDRAFSYSDKKKRQLRIRNKTNIITSIRF